MNSLPIRILDWVLALSGLVLALPVLLLVTLLGFLDTGSPVFMQQRVGRHKKPFTLIKFRTMGLATASVATHQVDSSAVTTLGRFLRKTKLDELPQLINVLKGDMSLVGPRPCLFNQELLIAERDKKGVFTVLPGITGLAQVNHIDMSTPQRLAEWDQRMIENFTVGDYFKYLLMTVTGSGQGDRVK
ncbi:sugar transferase [Oceanicoccus sagamiensis]|uniref:Lipid carrier--UDP-N-acetylgalactosaminyltransferase n=1 Tax=Oceanicoccus sagamiensis TaxID=716816 RepID=A0A1X9N6Y7_9GAMM|nr:sugar transferase [Oceanicoccus sagamiensis]ARN73858.1 lipid carrier--UDP-N-acetylgalactosaminyltransferase [Oceanicoccus sagamiensis]